MANSDPQGGSNAAQGGSNATGGPSQGRGNPVQGGSNVSEPAAVQKLRNAPNAQSGAQRMFTLDDGKEIIAYIDSLTRIIPTADATVKRVARALPDATATTAQGEVVQADRDRAWDFAEKYGPFTEADRDAFMSGRYDGMHFVRTFRDHRLAFSHPTPEQ